MCLIVLQPKGDAMLPTEEIRGAWSANPDGAGYMFVRDGELVFRKPFFKYRSLKRHYRRDFAKYGDKSPFVLHFRYATHGPKNSLNTHPHPLADGRVGLAHNGVFPWIPEDKTISDTVHFCRMLEPVSAQSVMNPEFCNYLEDEIQWNKVVLLDNTGDYRILNENFGHWIGDRWFSCRMAPRTVYSGSVRAGFSGWDHDEGEEAYYGYKDELEDKAIWERVLEFEKEQEEMNK